MRVEELSCLTWHDDAQWVANIILGKDNVYYQFAANWNNRSNGWHISIKQDSEVIVQGVKLVLGVNLLGLATSRKTPDCLLIPLAEIDQIERISFENMINGEVKLYHVLTMKD